MPTLVTNRAGYEAWMHVDAPDPVEQARALVADHRPRLRRIVSGRDVFISYAHARTSAYASNLRAALLRAGISCFLDDTDFHVGHSLARTAVTQIGCSRLLLRIEVAGEASTHWMDLEREVARRQGVEVATISLGGPPDDDDEIAFVDQLGEEPSAEVVVAIARRFITRRWRRGRTLTALALITSVGLAVWGLTTPLVDARSLDEVDAARIDGDWRSAAASLLGIPARQRGRVWLRYADEVLVGWGTRELAVGERQTVPARDVIGILRDERRLWLVRGVDGPDGLAVGERTLTASLRDVGMFGDDGAWVVSGAPPVLAVLDPDSGAGVWRMPLQGEPWRVLGSSDGDWIVVLQDATDGSGAVLVTRQHLRSGQTEQARWAGAPAAWFLGRCAGLDGADLYTCDDGTLARVDLDTGAEHPVAPLRDPAASVVAFGPDRLAMASAGRLDVRLDDQWRGIRYDAAGAPDELRFVDDDEIHLRFGDGRVRAAVRVGLTPQRAAFLLGRDVLSHRRPDP